MKKMITNVVGKHPFTLNDLGFLQGAWMDAFKGTTSTFPNALISGCSLAISNGTWQCSAGWISVGGEVYRVPAHDTLLPQSNTNPKGSLYWAMKTQTLAPSPVLYQTPDAQGVQSHEVHKEYYAQLQTTSVSFASSGVLKYSDLLPLKYQMQQSLFNVNATANVISAPNGGSITAPDDSGVIYLTNNGTAAPITGATFPETTSNRIYLIFFNGSFTLTNSFSNNVFTINDGGSVTYKKGQIGFLYKVGGLAIIYSGYEENNSWIQVGYDVTTPAFQNGWHVNSPNPLAKFRKDGAIVSLTGIVSTTGYTGGTSLVYTLPMGYRPAFQRTIPLAGSSGAAILIYPDGRVMYSGTTIGSVSFNFEPIMFSVK